MDMFRGGYDLSSLNYIYHIDPAGKQKSLGVLFKNIPNVG